MKFIILLIPTLFFFNSCKTDLPAKSVAVNGLESKLDSLAQPLVDSAKVAGIVAAAFKGKEKILLKSFYCRL